MSGKVLDVRVFSFGSSEEVNDAERQRVVSEIRQAATQAARVLRARPGAFQPVLAAKHVEFYEGRHGRRFSHPSARIWTYKPELYRFSSSIRPFAIDAQGGLWSWRPFRDWKFRKDVIVACSLADVTSCLFTTGILERELLPQLREIAESSSH